MLRCLKIPGIRGRNRKKEFKAIKVPKQDKLVVRFNNKVIEKVLYAKSTKVIKRRCECKLRQQFFFLKLERNGIKKTCNHLNAQLESGSGGVKRILQLQRYSGFCNCGERKQTCAG